MLRIIQQLAPEGLYMYSPVASLEA